MWQQVTHRYGVCVCVCVCVRARARTQAGQHWELEPGGRKWNFV